MYFTWLKDKTEKIMNEKDDNYIYQNIVKYSLKDQKIIERLLCLERKFQLIAMLDDQQFTTGHQSFLSK